MTHTHSRHPTQTGIYAVGGRAGAAKMPPAACGNWYKTAGDTTENKACCDEISDPLLREGCRNFSEWGWTTGTPTLSYTVVDCPAKFLQRVHGAFDDKGPKE
jgi:hypothetical protein